MKFLVIYVSIILCFSFSELNAQKLQKYDIIDDSITVSGLSSGGAMAAQLHVAFSSLFSGVGIVAGPPYNCANGAMATALTTCMSGLGLSQINVDLLHNKVKTNEQSGLIDSTSNLAYDKVYIFGGTLDNTVKYTITKKNGDFYRKYISGANIKEVYNLAAAHAMVTDNYGAVCTLSVSPYIVNCNYNLAFDMLSFIYDLELRQPDKSHQLTGELLEFDQTEFIGAGLATTISMDNIGYIYVPKNCKLTKCKLHVALHGCQQYKQKVGDVYARFAGYNQVADLNDIIVVYPQAKNNVLSNPNGCWDWWGYTDLNYTNKKGKQMDAIKKIIDRISQ